MPSLVSRGHCCDGVIQDLEEFSLLRVFLQQLILYLEVKLVNLVIMISECYQVKDAGVISMLKVLGQY